MIGVVDYGMGNTRSVLNALAHLGAEAELVASAGEAERAERLILPGVGAFGAGMDALDRLGFAESLGGLVEAGRPMLGICLGMQLLATRGTEHGDHDGLGLVAGTVERIETAPSLPIPHVGWNSVATARPSALFQGAADDPTFYFVHSFELRPEDPQAVTSVADYGVPVTASVEADGIHGVQFHPEKSQADGLALLENFLALPC